LGLETVLPLLCELKQAVKSSNSSLPNYQIQCSALIIIFKIGSSTIYHPSSSSSTYFHHCKLFLQHKAPSTPSSSPKTLFLMSLFTWSLYLHLPLQVSFLPLTSDTTSVLSYPSYYIPITYIMYQIQLLDMILTQFSLRRSHSPTYFMKIKVSFLVLKHHSMKMWGEWR